MRGALGAPRRGLYRRRLSARWAEGYGARVAPRLFVFVEFEFPWVLGPAAGRYLMRDRAGGEPERVVVIEGERPRAEQAGPDGTAIMVVDPVSLSAEHQAQAWLEDIFREPSRAVEEALAIVNRVVYLHRLAAADPHVHELTVAQAVAARAGWGEGGQLAASRWTQARDLPLAAPARRRLFRRRSRRERADELIHVERLAALLGAREPPLICEELALRARLDLDSGRPSNAALELRQALAAAVAELRGEGRQDLLLRVDELEQLSAGVEGEALRVLETAAQGAPGEEGAEPDGELLAHALGRLEAALRAHQRRV
jgi:hypothetical protein